MAQAHANIGGGHLSVDTTARVILTSRIWWPTLFQDANAYVQAWDKCQHFKKPIKSDNMPLRPLMGARAFAKWGIDFVEPIDLPAYRTQAQYIIVATDYLTKWVKAQATRHSDA